MTSKPSILFSKVAGPDISLIKKILPSLIGGGVTAGSLDLLQNRDNYSHVDASRGVNFILNAALGALGGHEMTREGGSAARGIAEIAAAPAKDMYLNASTTLRDASKYMNSQHPSPGLTNLDKVILFGGGALTLATALPALRHISDAASRIGSGHAIRVSTSIRHNNKYNDDPQDSSVPIAQPIEDAKPGVLSRLLHW